jgi:hypothetical protein
MRYTTNASSPAPQVSLALAVSRPGVRIALLAISLKSVTDTGIGNTRWPRCWRARVFACVQPLSPWCPVMQIEIVNGGHQPQLPFVIVDREGRHVDLTGIGELWDGPSVYNV